MFSSAVAKQTLHVQQTTKSIDHSMTAQEQDFELIRRMISGDENALRELYAVYGQRLYAYALRLTNDPGRGRRCDPGYARYCLAHARKFRGEGRLIAWLLGIVHHNAAEEPCGTRPSRSKSRETVPAANASPEEQAQAGEMKRWVRQGLQSLSTEHRAVLELVFYQGLTLNEVADVCKCPLGTVKSRLSYARQYLRGVLAGMRRAGDEPRRATHSLRGKSTRRRPNACAFEKHLAGCADCQADLRFWKAVADEIIASDTRRAGSRSTGGTRPRATSTSRPPRDWHSAVSFSCCARRPFLSSARCGPPPRR